MLASVISGGCKETGGNRGAIVPKSALFHGFSFSWLMEIVEAFHTFQTLPSNECV